MLGSSARDLMAIARPSYARGHRREGEQREPPGRWSEMLGSATSLNDMVRSGQQGGWDCETERLRGPQVNDEVELRGLLDRKVAGIGAPENPVHVGRGARHLSWRSGPYAMRPPTSAYSFAW